MSPAEMLTAIAANILTVSNVVAALAKAELEVVDAARTLTHQVTPEDVYPFNTPATRWMGHLDHSLRGTVPRTAILGGVTDKLARSMRNTVSLIVRIEAGWPRRSPAEAGRERARRKAEDTVRSRVRAEWEEWPERLNQDLNELLWDPEIEALLEAGSLEEAIERIKGDLAEIQAELDVLAQSEAGDTLPRPARKRARRADGQPPPHGFVPGKTRPPFEWRGAG